MLKFIDVYHGNSSSSIAAALPTVDGIIVKTTEDQHVDAAHDATVHAARAAHKLIGHYHFGWLGRSAQAQASAFVTAADAQPGETLWLDYEPEPGSGTAQWPAVAARVAWVLEFVAAVNKATGARCGIYANTSEWPALLRAASNSQRTQLLALPLWIAAPSYPAGKPPVTGWLLQQTGIVGGLDRDVFNGTPAAFRALGVPSPVAAVVTPPPAPAPAPAPKPAQIPPYPAAGWRAFQLGQHGPHVRALQAGLGRPQTSAGITAGDVAAIRNWQWKHLLRGFIIDGRVNARMYRYVAKPVA